MSETVPAANALCFAFRGGDCLVVEEQEQVRIPTAAELAHLDLLPIFQRPIGQLQGQPCLAVAFPGDAAPPPGMAYLGLRALYGRTSPEISGMAGRAAQYVEWDRTHRYCAVCGTPMPPREEEEARACPGCGALFFPQVTPAVIVLVRDGKRVLLARNHRFPPGRYSTIAGFVEPGETLEETVAREVAEEVGVAVRNICYFGSQPWPFPHSLMIAFTADYAGGEIRVQESEIADAQWFSLDTLPDLPPTFTIARQMIDWFIADCQKEQRP